MIWWAKCFEYISPDETNTAETEINVKQNE